MAHELRCIAFDRREIGEMVRSFAAWRLGRSPEGTVIDIQRVERDVLVTFEDARGDLDTVRLTETDGIACRLAYCRQRRLPVAQRFGKWIEATGNAMVLAMQGTAGPITPTMPGRDPRSCNDAFASIGSTRGYPRAHPRRWLCPRHQVLTALPSAGGQGAKSPLSFSAFSAFSAQAPIHPTCRCASPRGSPRTR